MQLFGLPVLLNSNRLPVSTSPPRTPSEVFPGIILIDLPLPSMLGRVNVFLIRSGGGYVLFDTGMNFAPCREALVQAMDSLGIPWAAVHTVFLSHFHPDHVGLTSFVLDKTPASVLMHQVDYEHLLEYASAPPWTAQYLDASGAPIDLRNSMDTDALLLFKTTSPIPTIQYITEGHVIPSVLGPLEVVWTPGHSAGHLCLYSREHQVLLSGDHILDGITPNIHYHPDSDPLGDFLISLDKTAAMPVRHLLPSHGVPFVDHVTWIERVKAHHHARCERIVAAVAAQPASCYELTQHLWKRKWNGVNWRFHKCCVNS